MKNEPEIKHERILAEIEKLEEFLEANPTGALAPAVASEIERLRKLLQGVEWTG
jgi:hypothetical protein